MAVVVVAAVVDVDAFGSEVAAVSEDCAGRFPMPPKTSMRVLWPEETVGPPAETPAGTRFIPPPEHAARASSVAAARMDFRNFTFMVLKN